MSAWVSPEIPRRFRHVHRKWAAMSFSEREAYKAHLLRIGDYAGLAFFESWEEWRRSASSPMYGMREGER